MKEKKETVRDFVERIKTETTHAGLVMITYSGFELGGYVWNIDEDISYCTIPDDVWDMGIVHIITKVERPNYYILVLEE